mgnify:CR=1 FL=1
MKIHTGARFLGSESVFMRENPNISNTLLSKKKSFIFSAKIQISHSKSFHQKSNFWLLPQCEPYFCSALYMRPFTIFLFIVIKLLSTSWKCIIHHPLQNCQLQTFSCPPSISTRVLGPNLQTFIISPIFWLYLYTRFYSNSVS